MYRDDLIKQWLWMKAAAQALTHIEHAVRNLATPSEHDRRFEPFETTCRRSYEYALNHWEETVKHISEYSGSSAGNGRFFLGHDVTTQKNKTTAKYRDIEVTVTMTEIRRLIEYMLKAPEMEERQMTMFDMLVEQAPQTL